MVIDEPIPSLAKKDPLLEPKILAFIQQKFEAARPLVIVENKRLLLECNKGLVNITFPASTVEVAVEFDLPTSSASAILERLRRQKKLKRRTFQTFQGKECKLYIPYAALWPEHLFCSCGSCENWNRFTRECTFFQELSSDGFFVDTPRLRKPITATLLACKWFIHRSSRALKTFSSLQQFADESADLDLWWAPERDLFFFFNPSTTLPAFRCLGCSQPMPNFGWGYFPLVGSSITSCRLCGSFYKLIYDEQTDQYTVVFSKEKFDQYALRYFLFTSGSEPQPPYCSDQYGLSLASIDTTQEIFDNLDALTNRNLFAFLNLVDFLVVRTPAEFDLLKSRLQEDYPDIDILLSNEAFPSVPPTKQQLGAVRLLRFEGSLAFPYSLDQLWSRV